MAQRAQHTATSSSSHRSSAMVESRLWSFQLSVCYKQVSSYVCWGYHSDKTFSCRSDNEIARHLNAAAHGASGLMKLISHCWQTWVLSLVCVSLVRSHRIHSCCIQLLDCSTWLQYSCQYLHLQTGFLDNWMCRRLQCAMCPIQG